MDFSKVLNSLGDFGIFQAFIYFLVCIVQVFVGIHMLANVFLMGEPQHRCYVPNCDSSFSQYSESFVNFSIPHITGEDGNSSPSQCEQYQPIKGTDLCEEQAFDRNKTISCTSYVYDDSVFEETIVSEFDIVCKKSKNGALSQSIFMGGVLFGAAGFGMLADRFGRRKVIMSASLVTLASSIGSAFSPNLQIFTFLRFLTAAGISGLIQTSYILAIEYTGTSKRLISGNVTQIVFAVGELLLVLIAYFVRKWKKLELSISIPTVILLGNYWLLPESVLWLISKGKHHEAKKTIVKAAKWNKVTIPENLLKTAEHTVQENQQLQQTVGPLSLVKTPQMRKWSLNLFFNWIVNSMVYYGLSLSASNLSHNAYTSFAVLAAVEIPAIALATLALIYCGRRKVLCAVMVFGGVSCGCIMFIPTTVQWVSTMMAVFGKSAISASFAIIYIYSAEIYPTVLRSTGIGISSMFSRIGGIIAPFVNELGKVYHPLPMIIFATVSIVAGLLALALPETHNRQLPETIEEAESFATDKFENKRSLQDKEFLESDDLEELSS